MARPPCSTMRATLCANSSMSTEPRLSGSDGALTVTPQSCWFRLTLGDAPKSDISDFGPSIVPSSREPGLGCVGLRPLKLAWARHGLLDLRWTLLVTAARRIMSAFSALADVPQRRYDRRRGATFLWSYCGFNAPCNYLNWQSF